MEIRVEHLEIAENLKEVIGTKMFKYLGLTIDKNETTDEEIKSRLSQIRTCIKQLNLVLRDQLRDHQGHMSKICKTMVKSIMTYVEKNSVINKINNRQSTKRREKEMMNM